MQPSFQSAVPATAPENLANSRNMSLEIIEPQVKKLKEEIILLNKEEQNNENENENERGVPVSGETPPNPLSKNQQKKQRKLAKFEQLKKQRRLKERERQKQKRIEAKAQGLPTHTGPTRKELKKRQARADKQPGNLNVAIDLDYDDLMHDRDVAKCIKQCLRIYTINRRSTNPGTLHFTGIKTNGRVHTCLKRNDGWENWHVNYHFDQTHNDVFPKEQIVYLTCESDTVLDHLEDGVIYIIGGLVDHNHQKGLCHQRATEKGLRTARLPLNEHVNMKTRAVLSTFHVFEILVRVSEGKSWVNAILETLPVRKGAKPKKEDASKVELQEKNSIDDLNIITRNAEVQENNGRDDLAADELHNHKADESF